MKAHEMHEYTVQMYFGRKHNTISVRTVHYIWKETLLLSFLLLANQIKSRNCLDM